MKRVFGVAAGLGVFIVVITLVETLGGKLFPGATPQHVPLGALFLVLAGWNVGSFAGGYTAAKISESRRPALILGILGTAVAVLNNVMVPPPAWFWALSFLCFVPPAWAAARLAAPPA